MLGRVRSAVAWSAVAVAAVGSGTAAGCEAAPSRAPEPAVKVTKMPLPTGFDEELVASGWDQPVGITFTENGRLFVWEKAGLIWEVVNGVRRSTPLLDIHQEVGDWGDHGMLGVALHPNFLSNGFVYLLYLVDYHHLKFFGTGSYNQNTNTYFHDTIVRLTRYTARSSDGFTSVDPASRVVLLGESMSTGCPSTTETHGAGSLVFGLDGTLLVTCGDGAGYETMDVGLTVPENSSGTALADGIITAKEQIGAYRSQLVDSLGGKILRLDPLTGNGIPSNPYYDASAPRSPRSRVWGLGLRNPYRMTLRPETGSHDPADADPGTLYIGDVGWETWEELDVVQGPGKNMGWPLYEGYTFRSEYAAENIKNLDAPNPLHGTTPAGQPFCNKPHFFFRDLLVQDTLNTPSWPNSCAPSQQIPGTLRRFVHTRPVLDWRHSANDTRKGGYDGSGNAITMAANAPPSPVTSTLFRGSASVGGVWYTGTDFPEQYRNTYFHADYVGKWIKNFVFNEEDQLVSVTDFVPANSAQVVAVATSPVDGGLYYINYESEVRRVSYVGTNGLAPIVAAQATPAFGPSPLLVAFTSTGTSDPEGGALTYSWNFGDGSPLGTGPSPSHSFTAVGPAAFDVLFTATDPLSNSRSTTLRVSVNNSPPAVSITSPLNGGVYSVSAPSTIPLTASLSDAEQTLGQLACEWQATLHHNTHTHPGPNVNTCGTTAEVAPLGCGDETYFYSFRLRVSDGFAAPIERTSTLYPDCTPTPLAPNGLQSGPPTFVWKAVMGADQYNLVVDDSVTAGKINATYTPAQAGCAAGTGQCSVTPSTPLAGGNAQFRVRAHNPASGWRAFSANHPFTMPGTPPLVAPTLIGPSGGAVSTTPTFSFNAVAGATDYGLWVSRGTTTVINTSYTAATLGCGDGVCSIAPGTTLLTGPHRWWARAKNGSTNGPWSAAMDFTVGAAAPPSGAPTLSAPTGTVTTATPTYQFGTVAGATHYYLWVDKPPANVFARVFTAAEAGCTAVACSVKPTNALTNGAIKWWVQAQNSSGNGPWSANGNFTVSIVPAPTAAPTLTAPSGTIATTTPSFQFSPVTNATHYLLYVNNPSGVIRINQVYTAAAAGCTASACSISPGVALVSGASKWWVQAQNESGPGPWSAARNFTVP